MNNKITISLDKWGFDVEVFDIHCSDEPTHTNGDYDLNFEFNYDKEVLTEHNITEEEIGKELGIMFITSLSEFVERNKTNE